jgi:hypothetical protein
VKGVGKAPICVDESARLPGRLTARAGFDQGVGDRSRILLPPGTIRLLCQNVDVASTGSPALSALCANAGNSAPFGGGEATSFLGGLGCGGCGNLARYDCNGFGGSGSAGGAGGCAELLVTITGGK